MNGEVSQKVVFVSGANRGIGHGLAMELTERGYTVVAGYREEASSGPLIHEASRKDGLHPFPVDVTSVQDLEKLRDHVEEKFGHVDVLINNAAVNLEKHLDLNELEWDIFAETFRVNVGGPFLTTRVLYPLLLKGEEKKVINISSRMGSIELCEGGMVPYRVSKSALNMLTKNQSLSYGKDGVTVVCIHPGWVRTQMGGGSATLSVDESVENILDLMHRISFKQSGQFLFAGDGEIPY